jgi:hypothetical protein
MRITLLVWDSNRKAPNRQKPIFLPTVGRDGRLVQSANALPHGLPCCWAALERDLQNSPLPAETAGSRKSGNVFCRTCKIGRWGRTCNIRILQVPPGDRLPNFLHFGEASPGLDRTGVDAVYWSLDRAGVAAVYRGSDQTGVATVYQGLDQTGVAAVYRGSDVSGLGFSRAVRTHAIEGFSPRGFPLC